MIEKICNFLMVKIKKKMPNISEEREAVIRFGLLVIFDEVPKTLLLILIAYWMNILGLMLISFVSIGLYRGFAGGFHLKTHIGCFLTSFTMFLGNALLGKYIIFESIYLTYVIYITIWIFNMIMITKYAPGDTENVPIVSRKIRKRNRVMSYVSMNILIILGFIISDKGIANILVYGTFLESICITDLAYKISRCKRGTSLKN